MTLSMETLNGTTCACCGVFLNHGNKIGVPTYCPECRTDNPHRYQFGKPDGTKKINCPLCKKKFRKKWDARRHILDTHGTALGDVKMLLACSKDE